MSILELFLIFYSIAVMIWVAIQFYLHKQLEDKVKLLQGDINRLIFYRKQYLEKLKRKKGAKRTRIKE